MSVRLVKAGYIKRNLPFGVEKNDFPKPSQLSTDFCYGAFKIAIGDGKLTYGVMLPEVTLADNSKDAYAGVSVIIFENISIPEAGCGSLIFYSSDPGDIAYKAKDHMKALGNKHVSITPMAMNLDVPHSSSSRAYDPTPNFGNPGGARASPADVSLWSDEEEENDVSSDHKKLNMSYRVKDLITSAQGPGTYTEADFNAKKALLLTTRRFRTNQLEAWTSSLQMSFGHTSL